MVPATNGALALATSQEAEASPSGSWPGVGLFGPAEAAGGMMGLWRRGHHSQFLSCGMNWVSLVRGIFSPPGLAFSLPFCS